MVQNTDITAPARKRRGAREANEANRMPRSEANTGMTADGPQPSTPATPDTALRVTKAGIVIGLLSRTAGATIDEMCEVTGWQKHSVRGFLAGTVKKKAGVSLTSDSTGGIRTYRIVIAVEVPA